MGNPNLFSGKSRLETAAGVVVKTHVKIKIVGDTAEVDAKKLQALCDAFGADVEKALSPTTGKAQGGLT